MPEKLFISAFLAHLIVDSEGIIRALFAGGNEYIAHWLAEPVRKVKK